MAKPVVRTSHEVANALAAGRPVVALESTIISHGMPRPMNLELALEAEEVVRQNAAVPATVAVIGGVLRAGLSRDELALLAERDDVQKVSLRDLSLCQAQGRHGATTVAATLAIAANVGIPVHATGGIGGVHRGASESWDVSADLTALGAYPLLVVCSGAKSLLDVPATLQVLETMGVPVVGWRTDRFPNFYDRGHLGVDAVFEDEDALGRLAFQRWQLQPAAIVVGQPVPSEHEIPPPVFEAALEWAMAEQRAVGVSGRDVTPFLLRSLRERLGEAAVRANRALYLNNVALGARLAAAFCRARISLSH